MHCPFSLSPLDDDFMRRGREGHKNNELGENRQKKGETGEEEEEEEEEEDRTEQITEYREGEREGGGRLKFAALDFSTD